MRRGMFNYWEPFGGLFVYRETIRYLCLFPHIALRVGNSKPDHKSALIHVLQRQWPVPVYSGFPSALGLFVHLSVILSESGGAQMIPPYFRRCPTPCKVSRFRLFHGPDIPPHRRHRDSSSSGQSYRKFGSPLRCFLMRKTDSSITLTVFRLPHLLDVSCLKDSGDRFGLWHITVSLKAASIELLSKFQLRPTLALVYPQFGIL